MKKIVILDFDGTIADTKPVILNTFHRTFDAMHLPQHSDEEIAATIGLPLVEAFPVLEPMDKEKAAECTAKYSVNSSRTWCSTAERVLLTN